MKKQYIALCAAFAITAPLSAVMTDAQAKSQANDILSGLVSGHNLAFGKDNLYKESLDLGMWNKAISRVKTFASTIIDENRGEWLGMKSSTLTNALAKITQADLDLVNSIKLTRGILSSPTNVAQQITILNKIASDMIAVQNTLSAAMTPMAKDEARKLLNSTAMFIETTATKAAKDAKK